jgi:hypothetical protein
MAGHGSAPPDDRGSHEGRKVAKESWYTAPRGTSSIYRPGLGRHDFPGPSIKDRVSNFAEHVKWSVTGKF